MVEFDYETTFGKPLEELQQEDEFCHACKRAYGHDIRDCGSAGLMYECPECGSRWIAGGEED